jgi:Tol biopolymer transport system component
VSVGQDPHISPDGKRLLVKRDASDGTRNNLWTIDLEKGTSLRITSTFSQIPVWSPDGSRIAYSAGGGITVKPANGLGDAEVLHQGTNFPSDWSPDGRFIIFLRRGVTTRRDIYTLSMTGQRKETLLLNSAADEQNPQLSPDGKWLAYASDDTGVYEIYVQSFSPDGKLGADRKRISSTGGLLAVWRRDGTELFFIAQDGQMMSSSVKTAVAEFEFTTPKALFKTRMMGWITNFHEFDVSPDGQRFLIGTLIGATTAPSPAVILNWQAYLKK